MFKKLSLVLNHKIIKVSKRCYTPRRALLYVPADDKKKIQKTFTLDVDNITLDCEDGVALNKKVQARENIRNVLDKGKPIKKRQYDLAVRVNAFNSGLLQDDLSTIVTGKNVPDTIFLPKVDSHDDLDMFSELLNNSVKTNSKVGLIMGIESAKSLINSVEICTRARDLSKTSKFFPVALLFGSDDYCATIGARRSESSNEVIYARQKIVAVAKAFDLQAIDLVYIKYKDLEGLKVQAEEGARFGFTGKQVIHPGQIDTVQKAFIPVEKDIEWAKGVLEAFHQHQQGGQGAFSYEGHMIDMPTMKQAQNIMDLVNAIMVRDK